MRNVMFSERAYVAMMAETFEHIKTETGGVFLGHCKQNTWYVIESVDPGPQSVFSPAYFEYDTAYINRLVNKLNKIYDEPLRVIGLWHRHPGSMDTFSSTDDGTNAKYAQLNREGAISALINIDPDFRLTVYEIAPPCTYTRIKYRVNDSGIPAPLRSYASIDSLKENLRRAGNADSLKGNFSRTGNAKKSDISLKDVLRKAFFDSLRKKFSTTPVQDDDIELILEEFEEDIAWLSELGIDCTMQKSKKGILQMYETKSKMLGWHTYFEIITHDRYIYVVYGGQSFRYNAGMMKKAYEREQVS